MMDRCTWYTTFETTKGDIQLSLQKSDFGQYFVLLKYYDKINTDTVRSAAWMICSILFIRKSDALHASLFLQLGFNVFLDFSNESFTESHICTDRNSFYVDKLFAGQRSVRCQKHQHGIVHDAGCCHSGLLRNCLS